MKIMEVKLKDKTIIETIVDTKTDNCPICDRPLKNAYFEWNMFHGEVSSSCCGAPYQTKDFYVDDEKKEAYKDYFAEINQPGIMSLSITRDYIEPYRRAVQETGATKIGTREIYALVGKYHDEVTTAASERPNTTTEADKNAPAAQLEGSDGK